MRLMKETRRLVKVTVKYYNNTWTLQYNKTIRVFYGDIEAFSKFLRKIGASDDQTPPRSVRNLTFMQIAQEIQDGSDPVIWIWDTALSKMQDFHLE